MVIRQILDKRVNAYRADIADKRLEGKVEARRFVEGDDCQVQVETLAIMAEPSFEKPLLTECLLGEIVRVFEVRDGWAWGQLLTDNYVGFLPLQGLTPVITAGNKKVTTLRTFLYERADIKSPPVSMVSLGAMLSIAGEEGDFYRLQTGQYVWKSHVGEMDFINPSYVDTAERFLGTPYLWGGRTSVGLDCSALVQLALTAAGHFSPRDSDMQEGALGKPVPIDGNLKGLKRGDLVFWKGHVGIMCDENTLLHANGYHMEVVKEPLGEATARIEKSGGGSITSVKRIG